MATTRRRGPVPRGSPPAPSLVVIGSTADVGRRGTGHLCQDVVIPANMQDVWLHYDYALCSDEPSEGNVLFDWFQLEYYDARTGAALLTDGPVGRASGWTHRRLDLNPFGALAEAALCGL